jgi:hypothetical protein
MTKQILTQDALLVCAHELGTVQITTTQDFVTISGRLMLIKGNPENRPIAACPNVGPTIKPCTSTLIVKEGYSDFISIQGQAICLQTVKGLTDGTPPGTVEYKVNVAGQVLVTAES